MKIVDTNVLVYAVNESSRQHSVSKTWLAGALAGPETVGIPWLNALAFMRLTTSRRVFPHPLSPADASEILAAWLACPAVVMPELSPGRLPRIASLLDGTGVAGNLVNDAYLAALALESKATVVTFDRDFARFGVPVEVPQ